MKLQQPMERKLPQVGAPLQYAVLGWAMSLAALVLSWVLGWQLGRGPARPAREPSPTGSA
jgi:hypothetical protein